ncbi:MAG: hypothetical protein GF364_00520 [Candidatus Lokiarchaeota archaeon]|nr:hypothetical protein [Candidatus Lokiarchaeota archaeon]
MASEIKNRDVDFWYDLMLRTAKKAYSAIKEMVGTKQAREVSEEGTRGAGGDITLKIDEVAEQIIMNELEIAGVPMKIVTEETGEYIIMEDVYNKRGLQDVLSIDPIDGSHNAVMGFPVSAISIAHANGYKLKDVDCGIVMNIYSGDLYSAIDGRGAFKNGVKITVNDNETIRKSMFGISLSLNEPLPGFAQRYSFIFNTALKIRSFGSNALGFCFLAEGSLDTFLDLQKKCRSFDIAAGYIILKEAGGTMWDLNGKILDSPLDLTTRIAFICLNKGLVNYFKPKLTQFSEAFKSQPKFSDVI